MRRFRTRLPPLAAFICAVIGFAVLFVAAGAPTPLLTFLQQTWGFAPVQLTLAFAIYAIGLVGALLLLGAISDVLGRRPVLLVAMGLQFVALTVFVLAPSILWVVVARALQGVATGTATSAFTAFISEQAPAPYKRLASVLSSVAPAGGLALGVFLSGLTVQFTVRPVMVVISMLGAATIGTLVSVALSAETVPVQPGPRRSLVTHLGLSSDARREFIAAVPVHVSAWMVAGLFLGLGPSILRDVFHLAGGALSGFIVALEPGAAPVAALALARLPGRQVTLVGGWAVIIGTVFIVIAVVLGWAPLFALGGVISGFGFGASFSGALRTLTPLAQTGRRAALITAVYLVAYLAFGVPVLIAGQLIRPFGLEPTIVGYGIVLIGCAFFGVLTQRHQVDQTLEVQPI